jgi:hypothetical protein
MGRSPFRRVAGRHLRGFALAFVLAVFAASVTVGVAMAACTDRGAAACGPIRFQAAPSSLNVGIAIGSTCLEPGITDYSVTLTGPGGFSQTIAQGSVSPPNPIVPAAVFSVPAAGNYRLVYTTTTNQGETGNCVTGTTELLVTVPSGEKPTTKPSPTPSPSPSESPTPTPETTPELTAEPVQTDVPTDEPTDVPTDAVATDVPVESPSEIPAGSAEASPTDSAIPAASAGSGGSGGGGGGGPDIVTMGLVGLIVIGGIGAAAAAFLYIRSGQAADAPWKAGPWKCARCNAINREGTDTCRRCYARWDGTS